MITDKPRGTEGSTGSVQSVARAIALTRCFENGVTSLTLTEMARSTGLNVSTAHRLLRTLCAGEILAHDDDLERYEPGPALVRLAQAALSSRGFRHAADVLQSLVGATGESASIGVRVDDDVVVVLSAQSEAPLRFDRPAGSHVPLHASAMGKALLAFNDSPVREVVAGLGHLQKLTPRTLASARGLEKDLAETRARGYSVVDEEQHVGLCSIGAPIRDARGRVAAAVAVQGPVGRIGPGRREQLGQAVIDAATELAGVDRRLLVWSD